MISVREDKYWKDEDEEDEEEDGVNKELVYR